MYNIRLLLVSTILLLSLVAVACGGDDDSSTVRLSSVTPTSQAAADATKSADRTATASRTAQASKTADETETPTPTVAEPTPTPETPTPEPTTEEPEPPTEEPEEPEPTSTPAPSYPLAAQVALQSYNAFEPGYVEIAAGGSVTFIWNGGFHNVVSAGSPPLPSEHPEVIDSGSFTVVFGTPGVYTYQCMVHPGMEGSVGVY